jgi:nitroreductase
MIATKEFLEWLASRRSTRKFSDRPIERAVLDRLVSAAGTAPSSTNRQPWRFAIVTNDTLKAEIARVVGVKTEELTAIVRRGHHADEFSAYGDFFHEPLQAAAAIIIPQYREYPDQVAHLIRSGSGDPSSFHTPSSMQMELCAASASVMLLLLQARAEGLGACWMAGPTVAQDEIHALLDIEPPFRMLGAVALGFPAEVPPAPPRRALDRIAKWFE